MRSRPLAQLRVLVVDDTDDTRDLYATFFTFQGAQVTTAADGVSALQEVAFGAPDIILLDLAMPRMTGWEVLRTLRREAKTQHLPVVVLSGQNAREGAMAAGADVYCEKPCLPNDLMAAMTDALSRAARRR